MKAKIFLHLLIHAILFFTNISNGSAQIDVLQPPTPIEKREIRKAVSDYVHFIQSQIDTLPGSDKKSTSGKFLKDRLTSANVFVLNDIDSIPASNEYLNIFKYTSKLADSARGKVIVKIDTSKIFIDKIKYDKIRRYHYAEAKLIKEMRWLELKKKVVNDTLLPSDSIHTDTMAIKQDSIIWDTIVKTVQHKETIYVKFEKEKTVSKNFRIAAIAKTGSTPKFEPLPALVTWWLELDKEWKTFFRDKKKMEEYPREFDLEKLTGQFDLDVSQSSISHLNPLKNFHNLEKLNCSNTSVNNIEPILSLKNLKILNISKTRIDTLIGIEKLTSLEEFFCAGNNLEGIEEVKYLKKLIRLDCSENALTDVSAVKDLIYLRDLNFSLNIKIKNIDAVKSLDSLEKLSMRKIDLRTLENLRKLKNLVYLDLYNTNITSLEPIKGLHKITYLDLSHNKMTTLGPIQNYKFITDLSLASSSITNLGEIRNFEYLRTLDISNTQIADLGPVHKFEDIKVLKAFYTKIGKDEIQRFKKNHPKCQITYY